MSMDSSLTGLSSRGGPLLALAVAASFLGSLLLFAFEPYVGKLLLPSFGGTPLLWNTCMVFFQVALLAGYAYAYALTRPLPIRRQAQVQIGLLIVSLALLPIAPSDAWKPIDAGDPTWRILAMLAVCVGLPLTVKAVN